MKSIEAEGKTTKEAIHLALQKLGVSRDKVHVKVLSEGHRGLFGMEGLKLAKVKVTLKEETHQTHHKA
ncbi:MAG: Jag N-terminal domain-containing protein [Candidatus Omnitrophica bacterium]|nr:Jag N-terminal domain-containing protein [Candidatus Omnitrophota bacterium]MDD5310197.1 Jag N-terminal domain-containing protein [Candidatus Omnitrophota bacterium]MDD5546226.1 Jag N-terminal domain-containing protein [Candidatus Omnitrophota bacterium]